jgi:hypothetical protein
MMQSRMKVAGFLAFAAGVVPLAAQSGFEHGHKVGSGLAYLAEPANDAQGPQAEILANLQIQFADVTGNTKGPGVPVVVNPNAINTAILVNQRPCAAFETWVEQATSDFAESTQTGITQVERDGGKAIVHRFVRDNMRQLYVSYTVTVETLPDATYRVSFGPPADEPPAQVPANAGWKVLSPAIFPVPQIMRNEDSIRLELYSNHTSRRMIEYFHVGRQDRMDLRKETPHDSYAEDAELTMAGPRLRVNGVEAATPLSGASGRSETIRGPVLWVYIPGHGRFVLSLHARPQLGIESDGEVAGNSLTFTASDGNVFRIESAERIAPGSGTYALHVSPDSGWEPAAPQDRVRAMLGVEPGR